jgi:hypothetical protein
MKAIFAGPGLWRTQHRDQEWPDPLEETMFVLNVSKKFNIKMTYKPPFLEAEDIIIGQLWEYQEKEWFQFNPKYLKEFDTRLIDDGRDNKDELLQVIKGNAASLIRKGYIPEGSKLIFSMLPVEQVF